ncbi:MAG: hypothetical protein A2138_04230 [Deltaproteobacteria bacterium RBG_16_71_12]|nr:MAG: hypothetical protein A2138_04230 [Deltaproteobacteria bacterium RBG_16_71_12]
MRVVAVAVLFASLVPGAAWAAPSASTALLRLDDVLVEEVARLLGDAQTQSNRTPAVRSGDEAPAPTTTAVNLAPAGAAATPQGRQFGVGLAVGYPIALTIKYMLKPDQGIAAGLGALSGFVYNHSSVTVFVDYVYHPHLLTAGEAFALTWYLGGGGQVIINDRFSTPWVPGIQYSGFGYGSVWFAARVPLGLNLALAQAPIEVFLEAVPGILVFPVLSFGVGGSIGVRFYL